MRPRAVAVLDTMWDPGATGTVRYFMISPSNLSGARLYKIVGPDVELIVTNACRDHVGSPSDHGTPDPAWLRENLTLLEPFKVVLLCGRVAETAYTASGYLLPSASRLIRMPHPAARFWTTGMVATYARLIQDAL